MFAQGTSGSSMCVGAISKPPPPPTVRIRVLTSRRTSSGEWLALVAVVTGGVGNSLTIQWHKADQLVPAKGYETPRL